MSACIKLDCNPSNSSDILAAFCESLLLKVNSVFSFSLGAVFRVLYFVSYFFWETFITALD